MGIAAVAMIALRILLGKTLGSQVFKRRIVVLGAGARAARLKALAATPGAAFVVVGYVALNAANRIIPEAIARAAIYNLSDHVEPLKSSDMVRGRGERPNT